MPVTEQQIIEADIKLQAHNIFMLASDEQLVKNALPQLARRKRPELKPEHYPHGKFEKKHGSADIDESSIQNPQENQSAAVETPPLTSINLAHDEARPIGSWMQDVGIVVERTFLHFAVENDISEASTVIQSAPADGELTSGRINPHQWRLPRPRDER